MRLSETLGRKVVGVTDATTLGTVSGFVVHPDVPRLVALRLRRPGGRGEVLPWSRVRTVGVDAVMARPAPDGGREDGAAAEEDSGLSKHAVKHGEVLGKRVLTDRGDEVGEVTDAEFDPESGELLSFSVSDPTVGDEGLDARRMTGVGSWAVVLRVG